MRELVDVSVRLGTRPGDQAAAAKFIQGGRSVLGSQKADAAYYQGKGPPPADDRWFCLVESGDRVVGYVAVANGRSGRIASHHVVGAVVPASADALLAEELLRLMFRRTAWHLFGLTEDMGYVTIDVPEARGLVREAAENAGFSAVSVRPAGGTNIVRYVKFPPPAQAPEDD